MPRFNEKNAVLCDDTFFPAYLFFSAAKKSKNISPAASFNPAAALNGSGFEASLSPSSEVQKKKIVIDEDSLSAFDRYGEKIAFLKRLQLAGFKIFLKSPQENGKDFCELKNDLSNASCLHNLQKFNEEGDYVNLAKVGVARDETIVFGSYTAIAGYENCRSHCQDVLDALSQNKYLGPFFGDDFKREFRVFEEGATNPDSARDGNKINIRNQFNFLIKRTTRKQRLEFVKEEINKLSPEEVEVSSLVLFCLRYDRSLLEECDLSKERYQSFLNSLELRDNSSHGRCPEVCEVAQSGSEEDVVEYLVANPSRSIQGRFDYVRDLINHKLLSESLANKIFKRFRGRCEWKGGALVTTDKLDEDNIPLMAEHSQYFPEAVYEIKNLTPGYNFSESCKVIDATLLEKSLREREEKNPGEEKPRLDGRSRNIVLYLLDSKILAQRDPYLSSYLRGPLAYYEIPKPAIQESNPTIVELANYEEVAPEYFARIFAEEFSGKDFSNLSVLDFSRCDEKSASALLEEIKKNKTLKESLSSVRHLVFSQKNQKLGNDLFGVFSNEVTSEIVSDEKYPLLTAAAIRWFDRKKNELAQDKKQKLPAANSSHEYFQVPSFPAWSEFGNLEKSSKINIAQGGLAPSVSKSEERQAYQMAEAGEVLNGILPELQVRTTVIEADVERSLQQKEYFVRELELTKAKELKDEEIESFKNQDLSQQIYCKFKQNLVANKTYRLLSIEAAEGFVGYQLEKGQQAEVEIFKGDDGFFYARANQNCNFSYVLRAHHPNAHQLLYDGLPSNNPIKMVVDEYRQPLIGEQKPLPDYSEKNHQEWLEQVFNDKSGSCRHKALAVFNRLVKNGVNKENLRIVRINNNHVIIEAKANKNWIKIDVGGSDNYEEQFVEGREYDSEALEDKSAYGSKSKEVEEKFEDGDRQKENFHNEDLKGGEEAFEDLKLSQNLVQRQSKQSVPRVLEKEVSVESFLEKTLVSRASKTLLIAKQTESHANLLLEQAKQQKREVFYIEGPQQIDLHRTNLLLEDGLPHLTEEGLLARFLTAAKEAKNLPPLLLINWDNFSSKEKVALNTILDRERSVAGYKIPDSVQIISLLKEKSKDRSFLSRHNLLLESDLELPVQAPTNDNVPTEIDLEGFADWRRKIFGKIIQVGDEMHWQKSEFVEALKKGESCFVVKNISRQDAEALEKEFAQAKAYGYFSYHGQQISLPENFKISCNSAEFDFKKFSSVAVKENVTADQVENEVPLINSQLFDQLLCDKAIEQEKYFEKPGLLEKKRGEELEIFISSKLTKGQWYCLFNEAQKFDVTLKLNLALGVELERALKVTEIGEKIESVARGELMDEVNESKISVEFCSRVFVTNNVEQTLQQLQSEEVFAVVDVEDLSYQDLIERIEFEQAKSAFVNFEENESQFFGKLEEGKKIILKGEFAPDLLQMLAPVIRSCANLTLIVEDKNLVSGVKNEGLKWLGESLCNYEVYNKSAENFPSTNWQQERFEKSGGEAEEDEADRFVSERKNLFFCTLNQGHMLRLVGHSGVGKSSLLREIERTGEAKIYRELSAIDAWAGDVEGKNKILFIDESNIEDLHFTFFSPLKNGGPQRIFYRGKFFDLDENHKVVFACNPSNYGGGRFEQKLFDDGKVPAIELRDFPESYIYHKMLKGIAGDLVNETDFHEYCRGLINDYHKKNSAKKDDEAGEETVREMQERALFFVVKNQTGQKKAAEIKSENFVSTSATAEVEEALLASLQIRQMQREGQLLAGIGLNGVLLEGDSGVGKSELIAAVFASQGLSQKKIDEVESLEQRGFYKIDASLPREKKKEIITKAFENGDVVWVDEINSCLDDGLEKILNAALTGDHPEGKKGVEIRLGFMLVASANSAGLEGRSLVSPALLHRTIQPRVKPLVEYSEEDLQVIIACWIKDESRSVALAEKFKEDLNAGKKNSLRDLRHELSNLSGEVRMPEASSLKIAQLNLTA